MTVVTPLTKEMLQRIHQTNVAGASGTTITTKADVRPVNAGDGFATLGEIDATVSIWGPSSSTGICRILGGDGITGTSGLLGLTVHSMGLFGITSDVKVHEIPSEIIIFPPHPFPGEEKRLAVRGRVQTRRGQSLLP